MICGRRSMKLIHRLLVLMVGMLAVVLVFSVTAAAEEDQGDEQTDEAVEHEGIELDVVTRSRRSLVPIAVPDAIKLGGETDDAADQINSLVRRNLEISGYFDVMHDGFFFDPDDEGMSVAEIQFSNWFNVGAHGLIKSSVREHDGEFTLDLQLYSVEEGRRINLDWSPSTVNDSQGIRGEVNEFLNVALEYFTGERGVFGSRIAFSRRYGNDVKHIYVMDMDGSNRQRISRDNNINLVPTFGANGDIYYTNYRDGNPDLFVYRNGSIQRLSSTQGQNSGATYCDGKVAVTMSRGTTQTDIYLIDPDTGEVQEPLTKSWAIDVSPTWSPDCSQIAFVSSRSGGAQIFVMNADGSEQRRLTFQGTYNSTPDWSPQGDKIVFSGRDEYMKYDIFTVDLEGNLTRLTQDEGNNFEPSFSPDGRYIVFTSDRNDNTRRLWLMTHDGRVQHELTSDLSGAEEPSWER